MEIIGYGNHCSTIRFVVHLLSMQDFNFCQSVLTHECETYCLSADVQKAPNGSVYHTLIKPL